MRSLNISWDLASFSEDEQTACQSKMSIFRALAGHSFGFVVEVLDAYLVS